MLPRMPGLRSILSRGFRRGFLSAARDSGGWSSVGSLFGVLFLSQIFVLLALGVQSGLILLRQQTDIRLEVLESATEQQIVELTVQLRLLPYVEEVALITKEQAFERQKRRDPELIAFLERFQIANPFPDTVGVRLKALEDYSKLTEFLKQSVYAQVVDPNFLSQTTDQEQQVKRLMAATIAARSFLFVALGVIAVVLLFVLIELVRRRAVLKSEEIFVQQLVGATHLAILFPFGIEVLVLLLVAFLFSALFMAAVLFLLPFLVPGLAAGGLFSPWVAELIALLWRYAGWILLIEIVLLPILAFLGAFFGLKKRLRVPTLSQFA